LTKTRKESKMYLIKITKGKETIIATGSRAKLNDRLKQLRSGTKGKSDGNGQKYRVQYKIVEENDELH
jgi:hypothetical protein